MQELINRYWEQINGVLSGFDCLVFRGTLRRLNYSYRQVKQESVREFERQGRP